MAYQIKTDVTVSVIEEGSTVHSIAKSITQTVISKIILDLVVAGAAQEIDFETLAGFDNNDVLFVYSDAAVTMNLVAAGTDILIPANGIFILQGDYDTLIFNIASGTANIKLVAGSLT